MRDRAKGIVPDLLLVAGAMSLCYGAWLAYPPAGFVLAGALAIYAGLKIAKA